MKKHMDHSIMAEYLPRGWRPRLPGTELPERPAPRGNLEGFVPSQGAYPREQMTEEDESWAKGWRKSVDRVLGKHSGSFAQVKLSPGRPDNRWTGHLAELGFVRRGPKIGIPVEWIEPENPGEAVSLDVVIRGRVYDVKVVPRNVYPLPHYAVQVSESQFQNKQIDYIFTSYNLRTKELDLVGWMRYEDFSEKSVRRKPGQILTDDCTVEVPMREAKISECSPIETIP